MAAVSVRINRALRLIGAIGAGETPTDDERADALVALNAMLDTWRNEKLMCYARQDETLTMLAELVRYVAGTRLSDHVTTYHPSMTSAVQLLERRGLCQILHATDTGVRAVWVR